MVGERRRRPFASLGADPLFNRHQVRAVANVQAVAIGPALMHAASWLSPTIVDLIAQSMPINAPHRLGLLLPDAIFMPGAFRSFYPDRYCRIATEFGWV